MNKFNGPGVGIYATSAGKPSKKVALYEYFHYDTVDCEMK